MTLAETTLSTLTDSSCWEHVAAVLSARSASVMVCSLGDVHRFEDGSVLYHRAHDCAGEPVVLL